MTTTPVHASAPVRRRRLAGTAAYPTVARSTVRHHPVSWAVYIIAGAAVAGIFAGILVAATAPPKTAVAVIAAALGVLCLSGILAVVNSWKYHTAG